MTPSRNKRNRSRSHKKGKAQPTTETVVTISSLGRHGHGIAETDNGRLFIPYTLPSETVRVRATGDYGDIIEIVDACADRIEPACPYFGECGGCDVQHFREEACRKWKQEIVEKALQNQKLDVDVNPIIDAHGDGRRRVVLHVERHGNDVQVGFMRARSHKLSNIQACPVLAPALDSAIQIARDLGTRLPASKRGLNVQLTQSETGLDVNVMGSRGTDSLDYDQHISLVEAAEGHDLARLSLEGDIIAERRKPQLRIGTALVTPPAGGFLQATQEGERVLSRLVEDCAVTAGARSVADLFCGIGAYALRLAEQAQVYAADSYAASVGALSDAVRHTPGLKPVDAVTRDLFENPLMAEELTGFDFVVFNPPRAGAAAQSAEIALSQVPSVVAVSCDPSTFARDARILVEGGYELTDVTPVDQFKWAAHVEIVGLFRRT